MAVLEPVTGSKQSEQRLIEGQRRGSMCPSGAAVPGSSFHWALLADVQPLELSEATERSHEGNAKRADVAALHCCCCCAFTQVRGLIPHLENTPLHSSCFSASDRLQRLAIKETYDDSFTEKNNPNDVMVMSSGLSQPGSESPDVLAVSVRFQQEV